METQGTRLAAARAALSAVESRMGADRKAAEGQAFALDEALTSVLPHGLRRGQVVAVEGSTSLLLALVARASKEGAWAAMVGMPNVGVLAAARRGIDLDRLALIPHPGAQAPAALGACIDGMDIVMVGQGIALSDADRRRLAGRVRERGCAMVVAGSWAGAQIQLTVEKSRWRGLGAGEGRLRERDVTIAISGRSVGATRRVIVALDADDAPVASDRTSRRKAVGDSMVGGGVVNNGTLGTGAA
ncbi:hypothetical protein LGT39_13715 [Demequina sp. TTPB684]|uniref:hypothetical protein n=1 Tax=unclassified Demequina TaxID=2620311 RepID=UPI001CF2C5A6|nr:MULTISPECIES: hypothetical protein [unclassified Demequina]MCB2413904.1 hypothetical protein [Demequina sp. TTPB684]UPU89408.1 hypothetical protein LGT36_005635 [Demequina sp. TMPB413]